MTNTGADFIANKQIINTFNHNFGYLGFQKKCVYLLCLCVCVCMCLRLCAPMPISFFKDNDLLQEYVKIFFINLF